MNYTLIFNSECWYFSKCACAKAKSVWLFHLGFNFVNKLWILHYILRMHFQQKK